MQKIQLIGNLGKDAEVKVFYEKDYTVFSIGCSKKNAKGESVTTWYDCFKYGKNEFLLQYLTKGTKVFIHGDFSAKITHSDKDNKDYLNMSVNVTQLHLIGSKVQEGGEAKVEEKKEEKGDDLPF